MSSVSSSDRNQQTDEARRLREEYEKQEAQSTKRKNKELRSMNEKHEQELQEVRDNYAKQLETIRNKHKEIISDRDERHSNDTRKLREMYVDSLGKKTADADREKGAIKETFENELEKEKTVHTQQRENLERKFKDSLNERDRQVADTTSRSVDKMKEGLQDRTEKLNKKHQMELNSLSKDRDRIVSDLRNTVDNMKSEYGDRSLSDRRLQRAELDRRDSALENVVRNMEHSNNQLIRNRDEMLQASRKEMQNNFRQKIEKNDEMMKNIRDQYADQLDGRTNSVIQNAKTELARAKNDQIMDMLTNRRLRDLEQRNLKGAYQNQFEALEKEKSQIFDAANGKAREKVNNVLDRTDKLLADTNRRNRMEQNISNMRNREALATSEVMHKDQVESLNNRTDKRIRTIMKDTTLSQKEQIRQHGQNLEQLKGSYAENLQNQREAQLETMKSVYDRMDKKIRDQESHLVKKHEDTVEFLQSKIDDLESQRRQDLQKQAQTYEARAKQREKAMSQALDSVDLKYKQQMTSQEENHRKELDRLEKRHNEQMQQVVARTVASQEKLRKS